MLHTVSIMIRLFIFSRLR